MDLNPGFQQNAASAPLLGSQPIFPTPIWVIGLRGAQIVLGFVILIMAGVALGGAVADAVAFGLVCGLFAIVVAAYAIVVERISACRVAYNYWAIVSLDLFMAILWLSSMGANAALRSSFSPRTTKRSTLISRTLVAGPGFLKIVGAIAGLSALEMLLFIGTLVPLAHQVRLLLQANKASVPDPGHVEMMVQQSQPMMNPNVQNPQPARVQSHSTKTHIWTHIWIHIKYTPFHQTQLWIYYHSTGARPQVEIVECSGYFLNLSGGLQIPQNP